MEGRMVKCPKCGSDNVFMRQHGIGGSANLLVAIGTFMTSTTDWMTYLCTDCGYFENYLTKKDWLAKIQTEPQKGNWQKSE